MALTAAISARISSRLTGSNDHGTPTNDAENAYTKDLTSGTTADKADAVFDDQRTLSASASENLDLAGGLTDALGATLTFVEIVAIMVKASSGNTNKVQVGGAASNAFTGPFANSSDIVEVPPGGVLLLVNPNDPAWAVTAGTGDILKVANSSSGTSVTYDITIIGRTA